ncbi:MAG: nucleotide exchange factor GrpE, partial [Proteobacteria bacterium]|nr:nucleotide exchange factor GrpE [Pseudomonadota bacterium]
EKKPAEEKVTASAGILEHPSYKALEEKLTESEKKVHENWEKVTRVMADLENARRRAQKAVEDAHKYGQEKLLKELLPVVDSLEQALQASGAEATVKAIRDGVELTLKMLLSVLEKFSVKPLNPIGEAFNPHFHEAMMMQEHADAAPGTILTVMQKGYLIQDRVMRPALVIVSKEKTS